MILFDENEKQGAASRKDDGVSREIALPGLRFDCEEKTRSIASGDVTTYKLAVENTSTTDGTFNIDIDVRYPPDQSGDRVDWRVELFIDGQMRWENTHLNQFALEGLDVKGNSKKVIEFKVTAPSGSRYGDSIMVIIMGRHRDNPGIQDNINFTTYSRQAFMAVKTQIGQERSVSDALGRRAEETNVELASILNPHPLRGYIIIESMKSDKLMDIVKSVKKAKGIVEGEMPFKEIEKYLTPKAIVSGIMEGDIVELVAGPFKGEKARVQQINEDREEITVELFEAMVPIPVTVRGDHVRVIEKDRDKVNANG